jgi:hypothetical protein
MRTYPASIALLLALTACSHDDSSSADGVCISARHGIDFVNSVIQGAQDGTMTATAAEAALTSAGNSFGAALAAAKKNDPNLPELQAAVVTTARLHADMVSGDTTATAADIPVLTAALNPLTTRCP